MNSMSPLPSPLARNFSSRTMKVVVAASTASSPPPVAASPPVHTSSFMMTPILPVMIWMPPTGCWNCGTLAQARPALAYAMAAAIISPSTAEQRQWRPTLSTICALTTMTSPMAPMTRRPPPCCGLVLPPTAPVTGKALRSLSTGATATAAPSGCWQGQAVRLAWLPPAPTTMGKSPVTLPLSKLARLPSPSVHPLTIS